MTESDRFDGLAAHVVRHLGPAKRRWTPPGEPGFGITLHYSEEQPLPVVSAVTTGLRYQPVNAPLPVELICTLETGQEAEALYLVNAAAQYLTGEASPLAVYDQMVGGEGPLIPDTAIHGLLFGVHPVFQDVSLFRGEDGEVALRFLTLLPLTQGDLRFLTEGDTGRDRQARLWQRWRAAKAEFWDAHRGD